MATTPEYGFVMPSPTDLVTDLPADFEIFGDAVDAQLKALNPGTTAGDVDYYTSATAKARLGIGTAGQVLAVNSGATAPEWATPAGPIDNFTLVNTGGTTLTGANTITISGITGAKSLYIAYRAAQTATAGSDINFRLNTNTSSVYNNRTSLRWATESTISPSVLRSFQSASENIVRLAVLQNASSSQANGFIRIDGCSGSGAKPYFYIGGGDNTGSNFNHIHWGQGFFESSDAITSISLICNDNFNGGTIFVYKS